MPPELQSTSPTGRYELLVDPWEARNSHWVLSLRILVDVNSGSGDVITRHGHPLDAKAPDRLAPASGGFACILSTRNRARPVVSRVAATVTF